MGVALAWPTDSFETLAVDISRLSDKRSGGWPAPSQKTWLDQVWERFDSSLYLLGLRDKAEENHWDISQRRANVIVTATLKDKQSGTAFSIGNYHMPCCYYAPMVMTIHSEMAVQHVQEIASKHDTPYILAGDFNIKPIDSSYRLITTGHMDKGDPIYPTPKNGYEWSPNIQPMRSAYAETTHGEPNFTNYARVRENEPFIDTLDYIFLSHAWKVDAVLPTPHRDMAGGPFPNKDEPSDHIVIAADLHLGDAT